MKATPLQQLILKLVDKQDEHSFNTEYDDGVRRGLALAIVNARELLEKEKEVIVEACDHNKGVNGWSDGLEYYKETYQNKDE
jgi:hypothetical protein